MKDAQPVMDGTDRGLAGGADRPALLHVLPEIVRFESESTRRFILNAVEEHQKCLDSRNADGVPTHSPRATGLLFGRPEGTELFIGDIEFVPNVRDSDEGVIAEFETTIASQFGDVFKKPGRGFWCDDKSVLQAIKRQAAKGLELMGSVHSHPNWHEIGPPHERFQELSENPTGMDEYLFRQSGWPVNVIWYVRALPGGMTHRVAAWRPGAVKCDKLQIRLPSAICDEFSVVAPT